MHMLGINAGNVLQVYSIGSLKMDEEEDQVEERTNIRQQNRKTFQISPLPGEDEEDNQQRLRIKNSEIEGYKS